MQFTISIINYKNIIKTMVYNMKLSKVIGTGDTRETTKEKMMTFRTFDIDAGHITSPSGTPALTEDVTSPVRSVRSRRRRSAVSFRSGGTRIAGFGF